MHKYQKIGIALLMMSKYKKPKYTEGDLGKNPFLPALVIEVNSVEFKGQFKKGKDGLLVPLHQKLECETSCRVYNSSERRLLMSKLSASAAKLLLWIIYETESGKDYLWLNRVRFQEENNIRAVNTYRSALAELLKFYFISRTNVGGFFWINPNLFFNGSRVLNFPKNVIERK